MLSSPKAIVVAILVFAACYLIGSMTIANAGRHDAQIQQQWQKQDREQEKHFENATVPPEKPQCTTTTKVTTTVKVNTGAKTHETSKTVTCKPANSK